MLEDLDEPSIVIHLLYSRLFWLCLAGLFNANYLYRYFRGLLILRAFRQSVRFSPRVFGGKVLRTDKDQIPLPQDTADDPNLGKGITSAALPIADGKSITVDLPRASHLIDDRYYNGPGYLLCFYPIAGEIAEGKEWSYAIEITVGQAEVTRSTPSR